ncbi:MAG TPA: hypothetical protein VM537_14820 [Anaerolineae bacterium]|nr:hypothetical protein [Anaerolineae bacterium]
MSIDRRLPFVIMSFDANDARLEDAFEYAIKPAVQSVLDLSDSESKQLRIDEAIAYDRKPHESLPSISDRILEAIRDSLFVICDTTGNRPNCYFELGFALAHHKHIFLLHRKDSEPPHFDIGGRPIIFYSGAAELRRNLETAILYHFGRDARDNTEVVKDFFERCGLPVYPLEGDGVYAYQVSSRGEIPITVELVTNSKFRPPRLWEDVFHEVLSQKLEQAAAEGSVLFNGDLVRLRDYHPLRDERRRKRFLRLECEPTDYFTFVSSNHCWAIPQAARLRKIEMENICELASSSLANPLAVMICVVVQHHRREWVLIQERDTSKCFHGKFPYQCSAGGLVNLYRDMRPQGIDVYSSAANEIEEELGIPVSRRQIAFLGLVREFGELEVSLVGEVQIHADPDELLRLRADTFEAKRVLACDFSPEAVAEFMQRHGGVPCFVPNGIAALVYSLLRRFPTERIVSCFRAIGGDKA